MAFAEKQINLQISLANGQFGTTGGNSQNLTGLRVSCEINTPGGPGQGFAQISIYGLPRSTMNKLTTTGTQQNLYGKNKISVFAGDDMVGVALVYQGFIDVAFMNGQSMPNVCFQISSHAAVFDAMKPLPSTSIKGAGDVSTIISGLASQMGYAFEDNGVNVKLSNPYYSGSGYTQLEECAHDAGIEFVLECGTVAIWPTGGYRAGSIPLISPETGLVSYPTFNQSGVVVTVLYNPGLELKYGGRVQIQSSITPACGTWYIHNLTYSLESQTPKGRWFVTIETSSVGGY